MKLIKILFFGFALCVSFNSFAQRTKPLKPAVPVKFRAPKLTSSLGNYKDTVYVAPQDADAAVGMTLKVTDAKNNPYTITSYQFLYKKIVSTEDEQSGKVSKTTSIKSSLFKVSPLPAMWQSVVRENLLAGEELFFFDVIAKDEQGRLMYAPNLKLIVK